MGHTDSHAIQAIALRIESRKEADQADAENEVQRVKAKMLQSMTGQDIGENCDTDAFTAAIRLGDAELIGRLCLMALDQLAERIAVREVYGSAFAEFKDEELGMALVNEYVLKKAGVTQ